MVNGTSLTLPLKRKISTTDFFETVEKTRLLRKFYWNFSNPLEYVTAEPTRPEKTPLILKKDRGCCRNLQNQSFFYVCQIYSTPKLFFFGWCTTCGWLLKTLTSYEWDWGETKRKGDSFEVYWKQGTQFCAHNRWRHAHCFSRSGKDQKIPSREKAEAWIV